MTQSPKRSFDVPWLMASTSNIQNSPLSLSSSGSEYQWDVFLSFGGDTRNTFTDHLFHTLYFDRGINTFRDSEGLDRGKPISPELLKAIEKSRIAVVILSENYVSSTWCLEELLKILECMDAERMTVLPIFYHVDPSHVRHLKGTIADAFAKHVLSIFKEDIDIEKKVHRWIDALRRVASLSGHHLKDHEPESQFMRRFVEEITSELNGTIESVFMDKYVGIESPVQEILDLHIDMASKEDVRFIGICGMSGIGKTTLAEIVFERIYRQFEASSFLRDVKRHDLGDSQEQLLRDMKLKIEIPRWDVLRGVNVTSRRLRNKKVIIVLDDVEEEKLETLARSRNWFGQGSRIIITTEDKGLLLRKCEKENIYNAKKLDASYALELFSREAFGKPHCEKDLLDICNEFVSCVDGHPLALIILGSSMHSITNIDIWKAKLESLRESAKLPNDRIQTVLRMKRKGGDKVKFSFDSPDMSLALECGVNLGYQRNVGEYRCILLNLVNSCFDFHLINGTGSSYEEDPRPQRSPIPLEETSARTPQYSYEDPHPHNQFSKTEFHPLAYYNNCFPPSKVTQEWFSQQSRGHSVTIDIPPNLCDDNNWMGLSLYACFSMHGDQHTILDNCVSEIPHFLYCQVGTRVAGLDDKILACRTSGAEITWLINQGGFSWISYAPGEKLKNMLRHCSQIEGSFVSDWPGVTVQACALRLWYLHDQLKSGQNQKQCNGLISEHSDSVHQFRADEEKRNGQNLDDEAGPPTTSSSNGDYLKRRPIYQGKTNEDLDRCLIYNSCFPQSEILDWFSHQSDGPKVTIPLPPNLYNDSTWTGLALFASFSVLEHSTTLVGSQDSQVHCRLGFLSQNGNFCLESLRSYCLTEEDHSLLKLGGFMWLSYIPRGQFPKWLNRCSSIEASISYCPGLTVQKCGLHLLYQNDEEEFKETIRLCNASFSNNHENEAMATTCNSDNENFDRCLVYNSCFPPNEVLDRFSHQSDEPQVTIPLPPNLYDDCTWLGLALFAYFSVLENSTTLVGSMDSQVLHCRLGFLSQNSNFCLESLHSYCLTEEDLSLLKLGGFMWLSYIPRGRFPKWLNRCSSIKASINDCLGLSVQKCGLHLLYQNDEEDFKETISSCKASFSYNHENESNASTSSSSNDQDSHPERLISNEDLRNESSRRPNNQGESDGANNQLCKNDPHPKNQGHGEDFRCAFTSQRLMPKLVPTIEIEEEGCTSPKTFPNQVTAAGTSNVVEGFTSSETFPNPVTADLKFIKHIGEKIFDELNDTTPSVSKNYLVGIDSPVQEILDLHINMASKDDVRFIGICGMSGIGKTTLAKAVFERIYGQFEASSFLRDIKRRDDLSDSQDQLLRDMKLKTELPKWDELKATNTTSLRLRNKKVIVVLDDVEEEKLKKLARSRDWFGPGSRIIITTEDKGLLLRKCEKENIYNAKKLDAYDALELFSREAFSKPHCEKDLLDICNDFVSYVDGHPLALKILGSSMHRITNIGLWKAELERLRESAELPNDYRIQRALRISYNGLRTQEKKLFLDVACFFNGEDKDRVADILEGSGCIPKNDIKALIDKSLITILGGKLWMHHLLQQMGWEIARQESLQEPGERSRLWCWKDVHHVLKKNTGTTAVEGIMLNTPPQKEERLNSEAFSKMENLKLLQIRNVQLPQGLSFLSNKLVLLDWHEYPLKSMPRSFQPNKLVELIMPRSHIKELPKGFSNLHRLKLMDLSDSQNLIKTPNFTGLTNLERVIFQGCKRLYEVHPSTGVHRRLTLLNLKDCKYLNSLMPEINLESLEILILSGCSRLKKFPEIGRNMTRLSELYLDGTAIEELPLSLEHLTGLTLLNLQDCNNFSSFPSVIWSLTSLQTLILSGFRVQPHKWHSLGVTLILSSMGTVLALWTYRIPLGLSLYDATVSSLLALAIGYMVIAQHTIAPKPNLLVPKSLSGLGSLVSLDLSDCNLEDGALPDDLSCLSSLQSLNLSKNHFTFLPDSVSQLSKLKFLYLENCSRLKSLPTLPLSIRSVMVRECTSLENYSHPVIVSTSGEECQVSEAKPRGKHTWISMKGVRFDNV